MRKPYVITIADCAGERESLEYATFAEALEAYQALDPVWSARKCVVTLHNKSNCDWSSDEGWFDGLTDDESEALNAI